MATDTTASSKPGLFYKVVERAPQHYDIVEHDVQEKAFRRRVVACAIPSVHMANGAAEAFAAMCVSPEGVAHPIVV